MTDCWRCGTRIETGISHQCGSSEPSPLRSRLDEVLGHLDAACAVLHAATTDCEGYVADVPGALGHTQELHRIGRMIQTVAGLIRERALRAGS